MTNEQISKAKECKSADELLALAKENGIEMTAEEAEEKFAQLNNEGELSDDELSSAAGGGCGEATPDYTVPSYSVGDTVASGALNCWCKACNGAIGRIISISQTLSESECRHDYTLSCTSCGTSFTTYEVKLSDGTVKECYIIGYFA